MPKRRESREQRVAREAAARARRTANAAAPAPLPVTEASIRLATALEGAELPELAAQARALRFDENYSKAALPLNDLVAALIIAGAHDLIDRVKAGDFDATKADNAAWYATAQGRAEAAEADRDLQSLPPQLRAKLDATMTALGNDPAAQQRYMTEHIAELSDALTGGLRVPDEPDPDEPYDPADVHKSLQPLLGARGPHGERLDTAEILAGAEMCARTGGTDFELGWTHDDRPTEQAGWYARANYPGGVLVHVRDLPGPGPAVRAFLARVLDGGRCTHCHRITSTDPAGVQGGDRTLFDGTQFTLAEQQKAGVCVYRRAGLHWARGCA